MKQRSTVIRTAISLSVLSSLVAPTASAWDSKCSVYQDPSETVGRLTFVRDCAEGPEATQQRLRQPDAIGLDEHRRIFSYGAALIGLPDAALETQRVRVFTANTTASGTSLPSMQPVDFTAAARVRTRSFAPDEFAMLPDFSFSLYDWASGNETCPVRGYTSDGGVECHAFKGHMGAANANHFPPQSGQWYRRLHSMALERARSCAMVRAQVVMADPASDRRFTPFWRECESEALTLEALAQHYMQDNWSAGHSWERWGSSDLDQFSPVFDPLISGMFAPERMRIVHGLVVGAFAGMIHGMEPSFPSLPDALCFPHDDIFVGRGALRMRAGGDDHLRDLLTGIPALSTQRDQLLACSASGIREVYSAFGAQPAFGALGAPRPVPGSPSVSIPASPSDPACEPYRATNRAFSHGLGIDANLPVVGTTFIPIETVLNTFHLTANVVLPQPLRTISNVATAGLTFDATRLALNARLAARIDPEQTYTASLQGTGEGPYTLLGVSPNRQYVVPATGVLASYQDPGLPWPATTDTATPDASSRALTLARTFHRAHAADLCRTTTAATLDTLRANAMAATGNSDTDAARCEACVEVASRHLRVGAPGAYETRAEPFCHFVSAGPYVYQRAMGTTIPRSLARTWCGCGQELAVLSDSGLTTAGASSASVGVDHPPVPVGRLPRDMSITGAGVAVISNADGQLVGVDLLTMNEVDFDRNPMTTTAGAPSGVTRVAVGADPRGVAIVDRMGVTWALVTLETSDRLAVVNLDNGTLCKTFDVGREARNEGAWDVLVLPAGDKAYVSFRGSLATPGNAIAVIDVDRAINCGTPGGEVRSHITTGWGSPMGLGAMALSPAGNRLAIAGRRVSQCPAQIRNAANSGTETTNVGCDNVILLDTSTDTVVTVPGTIPHLRTLPTSYPYAVSWFPAGDRVAYAMFLGPDTWPRARPLPAGGAVRIGTLATGSTTYHAALRASVIGETLVVSRDGNWIYVGTTNGDITALPTTNAFWTTLDADPENAVHGESWYGGCRVASSRCVAGICPEPCPRATGVNASIRAMIAY
jgi:DNA-binding beta-propeller fold protein YncE